MSHPLLPPSAGAAALLTAAGRHRRGRRRRRAGARPSAAATSGPSSYTASWSSVDQHPPAPEWFQDAKFGIYYHWGAFSVPAFGNEWYPRNMYNNGSAENNHHKRVYGDPSVWPYHNFINGARDKAGNFVQFAPKLALGRRQLRPGRVGAAVRGRRRQVRRAGRRAPRRVLDVEQQGQRVQLGGPGPSLDLLRLHADAIRGKGLKLLVARCTTRTTSPATTSSCRRSRTPDLKKLYGQLGTPAEIPALVRQAARGHRRLPARHPLAGLQPGRHPRVVPAELPVVLLQPGGRLEQGRRRHLQGRLQQPGEVFDFERGGPAGHPDPVLAHRRQHLQLQLVLHGRHRLLHDSARCCTRSSTGSARTATCCSTSRRWPTAPSRPGSAPILLGIGDYLKRFGESIYATRAWSAFGEGPTQMGGGSFSTPRAGTAQDIRFTRSKDNRSCTRPCWAGRAAR